MRSVNGWKKKQQRQKASRKISDNSKKKLKFKIKYQKQITG